MTMILQLKADEYATRRRTISLIHFAAQSVKSPLASSRRPVTWHYKGKWRQKLRPKPEFLALHQSLNFLNRKRCLFKATLRRTLIQRKLSLLAGLPRVAL